MDSGDGVKLPVTGLHAVRHSARKIKRLSMDRLLKTLSIFDVYILLADPKSSEAKRRG
jgi:hypothetical protein